MDRFFVLQNGTVGIKINRKGRSFYLRVCKMSGLQKEETHLV